MESPQKKGALIHHGKSSSKLNLDIWQNTSSDLFGQAKSYVPHMDLLSSIVSKNWTMNSKRTCYLLYKNK